MLKRAVHVRSGLVREELKGQDGRRWKGSLGRSPVLMCNCFEPVDLRLTEPIHSRASAPLTYLHTNQIAGREWDSVATQGLSYWDINNRLFRSNRLWDWGVAIVQHAGFLMWLGPATQELHMAACLQYHCVKLSLGLIIVILHWIIKSDI